MEGSFFYQQYIVECSSQQCTVDRKMIPPSTQQCTVDRKMIPPSTQQRTVDRKIGGIIFLSTVH
jgi:hypothetical protein